MSNYLNELRSEMETFLFHEARLLDELRFEEWLELFTEDAGYWMPIQETLDPSESRDPVEGEWALIEEKKDFLVKRCDRLKIGMAYSEQPRSRTRRSISNVLVERAENNDVTVFSNFIVFQGRRDKMGEFFVGCRRDRLQRNNDHWLIAERKIFLDQRVLPRAISVFL
jgi:dibenzofuran dioxygenase beta subunit